MTKRDRLLQLDRLVLAAYVVFTALFVLAAVLLVREAGAVALCMAFALITALCLLGTREIARRLFARFTESTCQALDRVIREAPLDDGPLYEETIEAKIHARLAKVVAITRGALEQSERQKKNIQQLVSDLSHQLNTPLFNLKMAAEVLKKGGASPEEEAHFVGVLGSQTDKLSFLIRSLVKLSRLENGVIALKPQRITARELLHSAVATVRPKAAARQVAIRCSPGGEEVTCDPRWTGEALENILENAVKYTEGGGAVTVQACPMTTHLRFDIADNGIGIEADHLSAVFQRFYRENRMPGAEGVGIGLYLSNEIIRMQGGYITVASAPGQGSTFSVFLPREPYGESKK